MRQVAQLQPDALANQSRQHVAGVREDGVEVQRPDGEYLFASKREQLPGQVGAAAGGLLNLPQVASGRARLGRLGEQHVAVALDDHQDVVEVVSDAARQVADGLELLGLAQFGLQPAPVALQRFQRPRVPAFGRPPDPVEDADHQRHQGHYGDGQQEVMHESVGCIGPSCSFERAQASPANKMNKPLTDGQFLCTGSGRSGGF
jgi:hypothetical protein